VVSVGLTVSALSTDDVVVAWADSLGSLFVAGYMVLNALEVMRTSLPDLLDRSAGAPSQGRAPRARRRAADYEDVTRCVRAAPDESLSSRSSSRSIRR
jgi:divalent metal cation (Fe/Co/Zn/Cd) transporter